MATDQQLELLSRARRWYMDATFWVVRKPFTQLFSIHAFLANDGAYNIAIGLYLPLSTMTLAGTLISMLEL